MSPAPEKIPAPEIDASHQAEAFITLLWRHIYARVQRMLHPHHLKHEPGGADQVQLPLGFLIDVNTTGKEDDDVLTYDEPDQEWKPRSVIAILEDHIDEFWDFLIQVFTTYLNELKQFFSDNGIGGGTHQVHYSVPLPITIIPPGPTNITGAALTISSTQFASDGQVAGSISPGGSFSVNGSTVRTDGLSISWADGVTMTLTITSQSGGTYFTIDVAAG